MGNLFLVATPIGNLEDITHRAVRVLHEVAVIAAEDTRTTRKLLAHYDIHTPLVSFHAHSGPRRVKELIDRLSAEDVAVVSEAGMPAISDPGYRLVVAAVEHGIPVVPIPGPSALVAAVAASGLPTDRFLFLGFLPERANQRRKALDELRDAPYTLVSYEAPHRFLSMLEDVRDVLGDRRMAAARELTKIYEEIRRGTVTQVLAHYQECHPRGEFTVVIAGAEPRSNTRVWSPDEVRAAFRSHRESGETPTEAARQVAHLTGWSRRDVYGLGMQEGDSGAEAGA